MIENYDKKIKLIHNADLKYKNIYVVGDIHGCYSILMDKLTKINFNFETDLLISVGDLVDKGPQSYECLKLLDEQWFMMVRGNHEELCIQGNYNQYFQKIHKKYGGEWFYILDEFTRNKIVKKLKNLPIIIELKTYNKKIGIIHANIEVNDWNIFKHSIEITKYEISNTFLSYSDVLWSRSRIKKPNNYDTVKNIDEIYLGHTIVKNMIQKNNCFYIDTGAYQSNDLTLVKLNFRLSV